MQLVLPHALQSNHTPNPLHDPLDEDSQQDDSPPTQTMLITKACVYKDDTGNICNTRFDFDVSPLLMDSLAWCDGCRAKASARKKKNLRHKKTQSLCSCITDYLFAQDSWGRSNLGIIGVDLGRTNNSATLNYVGNTEKKVRWMDEVDPTGLSFSLQFAHAPERPRIELPQARPTRAHAPPTIVLLQKTAPIVWIFSYLGLGHLFWKIFVHYTQGLNATHLR